MKEGRKPEYPEKVCLCSAVVISQCACFTLLIIQFVYVSSCL